jgi:hypothetical protein
MSILLTSNKFIGEYSWFAWLRQYTQYEIRDSHGGGYIDYCCLQCDAIQSGRCLKVFQGKDGKYLAQYIVSHPRRQNNLHLNQALLHK